MTVARVHFDAADLGRTVEPEGHKKFVQQAGMVIVAGILGVELPVGPDALAVIAKDHHRSFQQAAPLRQHRRAEIAFERLYIIRERAEQRPLTDSTPSLRKPWAAISKLASRPPLLRMPRRNGIECSLPSRP